MRIRACRFEVSAHRPEDEPRDPGPLVIFLGRSNVGKSSLINRLLGVKGLARTSSSPGRTQGVNFYRINESFHFVDLPGYGYARVPAEIRRSFKPMVEGFLGRCRTRIRVALLVVDARRERTDLDETMKGWLENEDVPRLVVATKADRLKASERKGACTRAGADVLVSSKTGLGIREVWRHLDRALESDEGSGRGKAWISGS